MPKVLVGKKVLPVLGLVVLAAGLAGGIFWWHGSNGEEQAVSAREEVVTRGDIISSLSEEGTASVTTQTTGLDLDVTLDDNKLDLDVKVEEILVRAGENVSKGDPLFVLDQTSLNKAMNTLNNAYQEAQLKADEASLKLTLGAAEAEQVRRESLGEGAVASGVYENTLTEMETKLAQYEKI